MTPCMIIPMVIALCVLAASVFFAVRAIIKASNKFRPMKVKGRSFHDALMPITPTESKKEVDDRSDGYNKLLKDLYKN